MNRQSSVPSGKYTCPRFIVGWHTLDGYFLSNAGNNEIDRDFSQIRRNRKIRTNIEIKFELVILLSIACFIVYSDSYWKIMRLI